MKSRDFLTSFIGGVFVLSLYLTGGAAQFSFTRSSRRDEYRIDRNAPFLATLGDVSYTLFLKKGDEMVPLASGMVKVRVTSGTCGGE